MNTLQFFVILINAVLLALVMSRIEEKELIEAILTYMVFFYVFFHFLKIKPLLRFTQTKIFNFIAIVFFGLGLVALYSSDKSLQSFFVVGILYFSLDALAYLEYKKIYGSLASPSPVKPKKPTSSKTRTSKDFFVECINCGEKNKNPTTDLCTKCGKSISIKSSTVKCTNCGGEFDSKESNCPYCATPKA